MWIISTKSPWEAHGPVWQLQTRKHQETSTSALLKFLNHSEFWSGRITISSRIRRWLTFIWEFESGYVVLAPLRVGSSERPQQQYNPPQVVHVHPLAACSPPASGKHCFVQQSSPSERHLRMEQVCLCVKQVAQRSHLSWWSNHRSLRRGPWVSTPLTASL